MVCMFIIQKYGMTALAWATSLGHKQVVDVLLKAEANPNIQDHVCFIPTMIMVHINLAHR